MLSRVWTWTQPLKQWKVDMGFRMWNVRCLCKASSTKVAREEVKYNLHMVAVLEVTRNKGGTEPQQTITHFSMKIGMRIKN
jgi:hypothetical protein